MFHRKRLRELDTRAREATAERVKSEDRLRAAEEVTRKLEDSPRNHYSDLLRTAIERGYGGGHGDARGPHSVAALQTDLGLAAEWAILVTVLGFVIQYTLYAPWFRDPIGRTIVAKDVCLILAIAPMLALHYFFAGRPELLPFFRWVEIAAVGLIPVMMIWRMVVWRKIHKTDKRVAETPPLGGV